jgi:hypothetical protein
LLWVRRRSAGIGVGVGLDVGDGLGTGVIVGVGLGNGVGSAVGSAGLGVAVIWAARELGSNVADGLGAGLKEMP